MIICQRRGTNKSFLPARTSFHHCQWGASHECSSPAAGRGSGSRPIQGIWRHSKGRANVAARVHVSLLFYYNVEEPDLIVLHIPPRSICPERLRKTRIKSISARSARPRRLNLTYLINFWSVSLTIFGKEGKIPKKNSIIISKQRQSEGRFDDHLH